MSSTTTSPTLETTRAWSGQDIAAAEAPLTRGTDRYMRSAAWALARAAGRELAAGGLGSAGHHVLLLVGGGHNGGDALLAGALLSRRGAHVRAALATPHPHETALAEARSAGVEVLSGRAAAAACQDAARRPGLVVDGLTGIGASGPLRPAAAELIEPLVRAGARARRVLRVLAVDLPSGTGVDDGTLPGPVLEADRTVTFTCLRGAHLLGPAAGAAGVLEVVDLGLPVPQAPPLALRPRDRDLGSLLREPGEHDHKYTRGVVGVWAGSQSYPGAAVLVCSAAVRAGAGMVRLSAPRRVEDLVLAARPEVVPAPGRCQALVIGPGTDPGDAQRAGELEAAMRLALEAGLPAVVDAGALALAPGVLAGTATGHLPDRWVLTPHAGEACAILSALGAPVTRSQVEAAPARAATALAEASGATVVLKTAPVLIASPGEPIISLGAGPGWLATAGSGDVLAGVIGAVLAAGQADAQGGGARPDTALLAAAGVRLHSLSGGCASGARREGGAAGPVGGHPVAALDLADALGRARELLTS